MADPLATSGRSARRTAAGVWLASAAACASFEGTKDVPEPEPAPASDGGSRADVVGALDASSDAKDAGSADGPFPVIDTFAGGCGPWRAALPSMATPVVVDGGGPACRMCFDSAQTGFVSRTYLDIKEPGRYSFQAQVRADGATTWVVALIAYPLSGGENRSDQSGAFGTNDDWITITVPALTVSDALEDSRAQFAVQGGCLIVRDTRLIRE